MLDKRVQNLKSGRLKSRSDQDQIFSEPRGHAVVQLAEALCYKPEGRGFKCR
jgi:hypothetical protein